MEMIPMRDFRIPLATVGEVLSNLSYYALGAVWGPWFFVLTALNLWDSNVSREVMVV